MGAHDRNDQKAADPSANLTEQLRNAPVESTPEDAQAQAASAAGLTLDPRKYVSNPRPIGEIAEMAYKVMLGRASGEERPIATPWDGVNDALRGGLWPGLYTLTSATGMGKTQWAMQVTIGAARQFLAEAREQDRAPDRAVYIALELGPVDLIARTLGVLSRLDFDRLRDCNYRPTDPPRWSDLYFGRDEGGKAITDEITSTVEAFGRLIQDFPIDIETADAIGWSYTNMLEVIKSPLGRVRLIVLDYSQLVAAPLDRKEELRQTIGNVARVSRDIARRHGCAVLALSSTSRQNYESLTKSAEGTDPEWLTAPEVLVGLGKESGELEYTADVVLALARRNKQEVHLAIAKGRGLPTNTVPLLFDGSLFRSMSDGDQAWANKYGARPTTPSRKGRA